MVAWPNQDMRIANPYPFAVRVNATASNGVLQVRLEGSGKPHPVEWNTEILQRTRAGTQQVTDPSLARGQTQVIQEAIDGLTVRRTRTIYWPTGPKTEESILRYPANDRIVAMGRAGTATAAAARGHSRLDEGEF
jgi:vancomycin resistance protein YoaR